MKKSVLFLLSIFALYELSAQDLEVNYFSATVYSEKVLLVWEMEAGSLCNGIYIQRASADFNFTEIGKIEGVCGNSSFASKYDYRDEMPLINQKSYYRLEFGGKGSSDTVSLEVNALQGNSYIIKNNPLTENSLLLFENDNYQNVKLCIYEISGNLLYCLESKENNIPLNSEAFRAGLYFFSLTSGNNKKEIFGKFLVN